jgi:hypothetical protein
MLDLQLKLLSYGLIGSALAVYALARILAFNGVKARFPEASARERLGFRVENPIFVREDGLLKRLGILDERLTLGLRHALRLFWEKLSYRLTNVTRYMAYYKRQILWAQKHW